jgi:hypothetical protein
MRTFASVLAKPVQPFVGQRDASAFSCVPASTSTHRCHAVSGGCSSYTTKCWANPTRCD